MPIKNIGNKILSLLGYEIRKVSNRRIRRHTAQSYRQLKKMGFTPKTVIDVGVAKGTPSLYNIFQNSYFLLIEPLKDFENHIKEILKKYNGSYICAAAGARKGQISFYKHLYHLSGSSLYQETMGVEADGIEITVPMIRLDDIIKEKSLNGPYLLKVDAQGAELDVVEGFTKSLPHTEAIVLEVSMFEFMKGAPQFYDVIDYMKHKNFVPYDIILGWNRPLDDALGQVDIIFVKENGFLRENHSYSTVEYLEKTMAD